MAKMGSEIMNGLVGNDAVKERLGQELRAGTLSHAYIVEGARGSGRRTLARQICAALACRNRTKPDGCLPCGECPSCRKILEGKSPDIIRVTRGGKTSIGVDDVRFLRGDVRVEPNDLENKIYVIEDADTMTVQAQNALLLTLEEPPAYVLFLLLCENSGDLLETIRSRAQLLRMRRVENGTMRAYLQKNAGAFGALSPEEQEEILLLSDGCIGRALELLDPKERKPILARRQSAASFMTACLRHDDTVRLLQLIGSIGTKREEVCLLLSDVESALRDLLVLKKTDTAPLCFYPDREAAQELAGGFSAKALADFLTATERARRQLLRNANVRLVLTELAF